jgi:hypothetical protein
MQMLGFFALLFLRHYMRQRYLQQQQQRYYSALGKNAKK